MSVCVTSVIIKLKLCMVQCTGVSTRAQCTSTAEEHRSKVDVSSVEPDGRLADMENEEEGQDDPKVTESEGPQRL